MTTKQYEKCRITPGSMGSYLLPPNHPGLTNEIEMDLLKSKENRGGMSLEYGAFESDCIDPKTKGKALKMIQDWSDSKPSIESKDVQDWINAVITHMGQPGAATYIKKYYPEYKVTAV